MQEHKPRIAFLSESPGVPGLVYEKWHMWRGILSTVRSRGGELLYVGGGRFEDDASAVLYDLLSRKTVDACIIWQAFHNPHSTDAALSAFVEHFAPLPFVSIERHLPGHTSVLLETDQGVRDVLRHLIEVHRFKKIVYVASGARTAQLRQRVFEKAMVEFGFFDPRLVVTDIGELDQQGFVPGRDYDAIVTPVDGTALNIIEGLARRGVRVPEDVAVTGFNDGRRAEIADPPLTTVRLPFLDMGRRAANLALDLAVGHTVPETSYVPMELMVRRSCGCQDPLVSSAAVGSQQSHVDPASLGLRAGSVVLPLDEATVSMASKIDPSLRRWVERVVVAFPDSLGIPGQTGASVVPGHMETQKEPPFLAELSLALRQTRAADLDVGAWHCALSEMRRYLRPYLDRIQVEGAEDLWQQARVMIADTVSLVQRSDEWQAAEKTRILHEIEQRLLVASDTRDLVAILSDGLPELGITRFALVLFDDREDPTGKATMLVARGPRGPVDMPKDGARFSVLDLLPQGFPLHDLGDHILMLALEFRGEPIGYLLLGVETAYETRHGSIYEALRSEISSVLLAVRLRQEVQHARDRAEKGWRLAEAQRELAEEANQLKSRFLSMVSHELRTPLNLIVSLSEMALWDEARGASPNVGSSRSVRQYLDRIYTSAQHLDRLIRDVLDLASSQVGQLRLVRAPVDLRALLGEVDVMGRQMAQEKDLAWHCEIAPDLPVLSGDRTRLQQVLLNLVNNAVKFTSEGQVTLRAVLLQDHVRVSVSDTGLGVPPDQQALIFSEFHQSERSTSRGYGGMGLGLSITRRLVELHGGSIWVDSTGAEGAGSTFTFTLPLTPPCDTQPDQPELDAAVRRGTGGVLVVVGGHRAVDATSERLVSRLVENGMDVVVIGHASFSDEVWARICASPPSVVVIAAAPTDECSWTVVRRLKERMVTRDIPILYHAPVEGTDTAGVIEMDYAGKPLSVDGVARVLTHYGLGPKAVSSDDQTRQVVLVVDDEPELCRVHAEMVQTFLPQCQVYTANNGAEALLVAKRLVPDLLLLDLMMPEMDGFEVLAQLREWTATRNIPVVILTAKVLTDADMVRLGQGVAAVLTKGMFAEGEILDHIKIALARETVSGAEMQRHVRRALAYIHEHYQDAISRQDISAHLAISDRYLTRCFNSTLGVSPMAYLTRYRIEQAKLLLETNQLTVTDVALSVGFSSQSYFSRVFGREVGVSPSAYQKGRR